MAPPGMPNMMSTPWHSRLRTSAWAPVTSTGCSLLRGPGSLPGPKKLDFLRSACSTKNLLAAGRGGVARARLGLALGDKEYSEQRDHSSCSGVFAADVGRIRSSRGRRRCPPPPTLRHSGADAHGGCARGQPGWAALLEASDGVGMLEGDADVVEAFKQPPARVIRQLEAGAQPGGRYGDCRPATSSTTCAAGSAARIAPSSATVASSACAVSKPAPMLLPRKMSAKLGAITASNPKSCSAQT